MGSRAAGRSRDDVRGHGCSVAPHGYYDDETRRCLTALEGHVDTRRAAAVWEAALAARWRGTPVWFHGDIAADNLLVADGAVTAVIDFGTSGVGDPACVLVIAWGMFSGDSREAFRRTVAKDAGTWARARGWSLWKSLLVMSEPLGADPERTASHHRVIDEVLADHDRFGGVGNGTPASRS
ncbi:phosphotransferase [Streptomyces sp. NPDC056982]|uniref:phosphotransferase n=1 Tax=Streptomyces sp. NPDC056982 TaxID=3345986 RepID=UPI00362F2708